MFVSLIGAIVVLGVFVALAFLSEKILWSGWRASWSEFWTDWRYIFPGYRKQQALYKELSDEYEGLFRLVYGDAWGNTGLETKAQLLTAKVRDLEQVLGWTRNSLADAKDEILYQMKEADRLRTVILGFSSDNAGAAAPQKKRQVLDRRHKRK